MMMMMMMMMMWCVVVGFSIDGPRRLKFAPRGARLEEDEEAVVMMQVATKNRSYFAGFWRVWMMDAEANYRVFLSMAGGVVAPGHKEGRWLATCDESSLELRVELAAIVLVTSNATLLSGRRRDLRFQGIVLEGATDSDYAGRCAMEFASPLVSDAEIVNEALRYHARASRYVPAPRFSPASFASREWRLVATIDDMPAVFDVVLMANGTFASTGDDRRIGGAWGVFDDDNNRERRDGLGSHAWIWIRRSKSTGLNMHADLRFDGRIDLEKTPTLEAELARRTDPVPGGVRGVVLFGDIPDMEYSALVGTFHLRPRAGDVIMMTKGGD